MRISVSIILSESKRNMLLFNCKVYWNFYSDFFLLYFSWWNRWTLNHHTASAITFYIKVFKSRYQTADHCQHSFLRIRVYPCLTTFIPVHSWFSVFVWGKMDKWEVKISARKPIFSIQFKWQFSWVKYCKLSISLIKVEETARYTI